MKKIYLNLSLLVILWAILGSANQMLAQSFAGGSGTEVDPYQIETPEQLDSVRHHLSSYFILNNDIDLSFYTGDPAGGSWNGGEGWEPIGDANPFTGSLDGNGFTITGLSINRQNDVGLFGDLGSSGEINNLGIEEIDITGTGVFVGSLAGRNSGTISNSYARGNIIASGSEYVGGLVGVNNGGVIIKSYAGGLIRGAHRVGGLSGANTGTISNSYATIRVNGTDPAGAHGGLVGELADGQISRSYATGSVNNAFPRNGGLVGWNTGGEVTDSYWNTDTGDPDTSGSDLGFGTGLTTTQMLQQASFSDWDFTNTWTIINSEGFLSYPALQNNAQDPPPGLTKIFAGGSGTSNDPWQIETPEQLDVIRDFLDAQFILNNDIDLSFATGDPGGQFWNEGKGWEPIGHKFNGYKFTGLFDGNGFTVRGLTINRPSEDRIGLFGDLQIGSIISNLGVEDVDVTGNNQVGGLARVNRGTITNSYVTGSISGNEPVGGLTGRNDGTIKNSYASASVNGVNAVGGLVGTSGYDTGAEIINSYATGSVTGFFAVGGLLGNNSGGISLIQEGKLPTAMLQEV